jgi:hypothetical protein
MLETKVIEEIKTHMLCPTKVFVENHVFMRMRILRWISKAINTHSYYVIPVLFHYTNSCTNAPQCYDIACLVN